MVIWWLAIGALYVLTLNCWGAAYRYRIQKGVPSSTCGPGWFTPIWRAGRWLEPRRVRLVWLGNLAFLAATILAYFAHRYR